MLTAFTFYDESSGDWSGVVVRCLGLEDAQCNAPAGTVTVPAPLHPHAMRWVDGVLVDYQPPQPSADHEWDDGEKSWRLTASALARANRRHFASQRIMDLERQQARAVREALLGDATAQTRLQAIEDEIVQKRRDL